MLDGDWGSNSDKIMAAFAVFALVISTGHVIWDIWIRDFEDKDWQVKLQNAQNKWQGDFETELAATQRRWEEELDQRQAERERQWRIEEEERLSRWREEDLRRQEQSYVPKLEVSVEMGFSIFDPLTGISDTRLFTDAVNIGTIPVFFSQWGGFKVNEENKWIEWPPIPGPNTSLYYGTDYDFRQPLAIGQRCRTYFSLAKMKEALKREGKSGVVSIQGYYTDQRGQKHLSEPFPVDVDTI